MQVTLHSDKPGAVRRNRLQTRFDKLYDRIQREEKRNDRFAEVLDGLVREFELARGEIELDALDSTRRLGERLVEFFGRKSLAEWHRQALIEWIAELCERLAEVDPEAATALHQRLVSALSRHLNMSEDEMRAQAKAQIEALEDGFDLDDEFDPDDEDPFIYADDDIQPDMFEREGEPGAGNRHGPGGGAENDFNPDGSPTGGAAQWTGAEWLRGLFRRAAQALHPDRESDPDRRAYKQEQMQQLLRARKDGDVLTILRLNAEATGRSELALAESEMNGACKLMQRRLDRLEHERDEIIEQSPLHAWVHHMFYAATRKKRELCLKRWREATLREAQETGRLVEELRNLKVLKAHLERRRRLAEESLWALEELVGSPFI